MRVAALTELLKLVLIERLFSLTRDKLMKIPAFAGAYAKVPTSQSMVRSHRSLASHTVIEQGGRRNYVAQMKRSSAVPFRQS